MTLDLLIISGGTVTKALDVVAVTLLVFVGLLWFMNKGVPWFVNLTAQDEHAVIAVGAGAAVAGVVWPQLWFLLPLGVIVAGYGLLARFTGYVDIGEVL